MKVSRQDLSKSKIELNVEFSVEEFNPFIKKAAEILSKEIKIEGFRPGKVPFEVLKQKIGEMSILEEASHICINNKIFSIISENIKDKQIFGQPEINITKLAPGNPLEFKITVSILPEVTIGEYKKFALNEEKVKATEEDMNKILNDIKEMRAVEKISDSGIKIGDKVMASVNLFIDKVPVEDGQNPEITIMIGKNYFVEGFDKNLIDLKKGDKKEFNIVYPKNHWQKNLAGKSVDFKIEIKEVYDRALPELSDNLAKDFRFNTLDELKSNLKQTIEIQKKKEADQKLEIKIFDKILEKSKFGEIAEDLIKNESQLMLREMEQGVVSQGGKLEDYLKSIGKTEDQLLLDFMPNAVKRVKSALILKEIAKIEKIEVSPEEIEKELETLKNHYKDNAEIIKNISSPAYRSYLENFILNQKIINNLKKWNLS